ncbi:MAG: hypothetical protein WBI18_07735 [Candidatus Saccharicenans sp.]
MPCSAKKEGGAFFAGFLFFITAIFLFGLSFKRQSPTVSAIARLTSPGLSDGEAAGRGKFFSGGVPPVGLLPAGFFRSAAQSDPIIYSGQFALLYSDELALAVPIDRGWKRRPAVDKNGQPILIIFPPEKEESRDGRIEKYDNAIMINITDNSAGQTLERFVADELNALASPSSDYEYTGKHVVVSRFGWRFLFEGLLSKDASNSILLGASLCRNKIIRLLTIFSGKEAQDYRYMVNFMAVMLLPFRISGTDSEGSVIPHAEMLVLPAEEECRRYFSDFDPYESWAKFAPGTSLSFNYVAAYPSLTYRIKKRFSFEALDREAAAINFLETGEVRKTGLKEAFPPIKTDKMLELTRWPEPSGVSNPYFNALGPNPLNFLDSDLALINRTVQERLKTDALETEAVKVSFLYAYRDSLKRADFWFSPEVPGFLLKAETATASVKKISAPSAEIQEKPIEAMFQEEVEMSEKLVLESSQVKMKQTEVLAGEDAAERTSEIEVPALYYLQRKLGKEASRGVPVELEMLEYLFPVLLTHYSDLKVEPLQVALRLEPVLEMAKKLKEPYQKFLQAASSELEEESYRIISAAIGLVMSSIENKLNWMEGIHQLISMTNVPPAKKKESAGGLIRLQEESFAGSQRTRNEYLSVLRSLQNVKLKYKSR